MGSFRQTCGSLCRAAGFRRCGVAFIGTLKTHPIPHPRFNSPCHLGDGMRPFISISSPVTFRFINS